MPEKGAVTVAAMSAARLDLGRVKVDLSKLVSEYTKTHLCFSGCLCATLLSLQSYWSGSILDRCCCIASDAGAGSGMQALLCFVQCGCALCITAGKEMPVLSKEITFKAS